MASLTLEQEGMVEEMRQAATELAGKLTVAVEAGIAPAILLPELLSVLKASGIQVPRGLPFIG